MSAASKLKVFISYSRADAKFADELVAGLEFKEEFEVTLDRHSIIEGEDWKKRLGALIADADTVVFMLSPDSAQSPICGWEVEEAHRLSKRILPVLARPLGGIPAPPLLAALNYVRFDEERSFMAGLAALVRSLKTDVDWLREHTRLLTRAMEWDAAKRPANRLLSGNDIVAAKDWLARRPKDAPEATGLHLDFMRASEQAEVDRTSAERKQLEEMAAAQSQRAAALAERETAVKRLQVWTRRGITAAAAGALGGAGLGYWGFDAERRVRQEQENTKKAAAEALEQAIVKEAMRTDIAGQLVAYAAAPGQLALDGPQDGHSPFTQAMLEALADRSTSLLGAIARTNRRVLELSIQLNSTIRQRPYYSSDLNGDIFLFRRPKGQRNLALLISVDALRKPPLKIPNVVRDAKAWEDLLKQAGFVTTSLTNPSLIELQRAFDKLMPPPPERKGAISQWPIQKAAALPRTIDRATTDRAMTDDLILVFYAGFGFTIESRDFVAAADTELSDDGKSHANGLDLSQTLKRLREYFTVSVVVADTNFEDVASTVRSTTR